MTLVESGELDLATPARSLVRDDLPLIDERVTVEHLLSHRSGAGDYFDEEAIQDPSEYVMPVSVHLLASSDDYLRVLDGHQQVFAAGERFSYTNSGFVVLALIAERASGIPFERLIQERVCGPAEMPDTAFLRSDEPAERAALGYPDAHGLRTNVLQLPVLGSGDGGLYSTAADVRAFWLGLFSGRIVGPDHVADMMRPRSEVPDESKRYGLGMWLHATGRAVMLEGYDAGVSFRTVHDPGGSLTYTVLSNTTDGAWPIVRRLDELLEPQARSS